MYADLERRFGRALQLSGVTGTELPYSLGEDTVDTVLIGTCGSRAEVSHPKITVGVRVLVEMRCCDEAAIAVRRKLRAMGATVRAYGSRLGQSADRRLYTRQRTRRLTLYGRQAAAATRCATRCVQAGMSMERRLL